MAMMDRSVDMPDRLIEHKQIIALSNRYYYIITPSLYRRDIDDFFHLSIDFACILQFVRPNHHSQPGVRRRWWASSLAH
jgi:hypothetical protein